ncbi:glycosyl hydrolase family 18 [Colletotrichum kahawae]|uniref:Glycosyl hydrolase family 18 n=1 Tax=Colletotrichum kahawae TaxID=34407 RepID=A0AAD9YA08_COLKA|nr:glycosyl hydrolase family 18 [Colletotrichum kahawae]
MAVFCYLKFVPPGSVTGQKYEKLEAIWNKRMRVSNWIDFLFWEFDRQFTALGGMLAGVARSSRQQRRRESLAARLNVRALHDRGERGKLHVCTTAEAKYLNAHGPLNAQGMRQWTGPTTDPAWYNSAFGPGCGGAIPEG